MSHKACFAVGGQQSSEAVLGASVAHGRNSNRDFDQVPPGVCQSCDGQKVLWTGGFLGKPNRSVTCPDCDGTGTR